MSAVGECMLRITATAILCAVATQLGVGGISGNALRFMCGIFFLLSLLRPLTDLDIRTPADLFLDICEEGRGVAAVGENLAQDAKANIIIGKLQTYIQDKGAAMGLELEVGIGLSPELTPESVTLRGDASPYQRNLLMGYIRDELGIDLEAQTWIN